MIQNEHRDNDITDVVEAYENVHTEVIDAGKAKREARKLCSKLGFSFVAFLGMTILIQVVIVLLLKSGIISFSAENPNISLILSDIAMYIFGFPAFYFICRGIASSAKIKKTKWSTKQLAVCMIVCIGVMYVGDLIGQVLMSLVSVLTEGPNISPMEELLDGVSLPLSFLMTVVIAPIMEELMFRKILIDRTVRYGQGISIVLSGILFGLTHGNFYQFFYACGLGAIFAYIYVKTGRLSYAIVFHMIINFLGGIVPMFMQELTNVNEGAGLTVETIYSGVIIVCIILSVILLVKGLKRIILEPGIEQIPRGGIFKTLFINAGMLSYLAMCTLIFFMG